MSINSISHLQWQSLNIFKLLKYLLGISVFCIVLSFSNTAKASCQFNGYGSPQVFTYTASTLNAEASSYVDGFLFCKYASAPQNEWTYLPYICSIYSIPAVATSSTGKTLPFTFTGNAFQSNRAANDVLINNTWYNGPPRPTTSPGIVVYNFYGKVPAGYASTAAAGTYVATVRLQWEMKSSSGGCSLTGSELSGSTEVTFHFVVPSSCTMNSVSSMNFGEIVSFGGIASKDYVSTAAIRNTCTADTRYTLYLGNGNNRITGGMRRMANGSNYIPYQLYKNASYSTVWDATGGTTSVGGSGGRTSTGTATQQVSTIYGKIPKGTSISSVLGTYTDTVVVTLTY